MKTITRLAMAVGVATLMTEACRDAAGPETLSVTITAALTDGPLGVIHPSGIGWLVGCDAELMLRVTGKSGEGVRWTGATLDFGRAGGILALTAGEVAELFAGSTLTAGEDRHISVRFTAPEPFRLAAGFRYVPLGGGGQRTAEYVHDCTPPGGVPTGRYVLRTINDVPLPAPSELSAGVEYDTLTFFPNMTYTTSSDVVESSPSRTGPDPYRIPSADVLDLGAITGGAAAAPGSVRRVPGWVIYTETRPGRPTFVWRFEKIQ